MTLPIFSTPVKADENYFLDISIAEIRMKFLKLALAEILMKFQ